MNNEKEIEEIIHLIQDVNEIYVREVDDDGFSDIGYSDRYCVNKKVAETLVKAGYGNVKQYQDEIDRLETELMHREEDLVHADEKVFYREMAVKLDEDKIKKQAVKEFAKKLKERFGNYRELSVKQSCCIIDDLITELYGADE